MPLPTRVIVDEDRILMAYTANVDPHQAPPQAHTGTHLRSNPNTLFLNVIITAIFLALLFDSCSTTNSCLGVQAYTIKLYGAGGITGAAAGTTLECGGRARLWSKALNASERVTDSFQVEESTMTTIGDLLQDSSLFSYRSKYVENFVTYLEIKKGTRLNEISFDQSNPPQDMPESMKKLIAQIEMLSKR